MVNPILHLRRELCRVFAAFLVVLLLGVHALPSRADSVVHFYYFYDPTCSSCEEVHKQVLEPLLAKYGARIAAEERSINVKANFDLMLALEAHYQVAVGSIPEVYIGDKALIGPDEITAGLEQQIEANLQTGVALPPDPAPAPTTATSTPLPAGVAGNATVKMMLFWSPTCPHCENVLKNILPPIQLKYGALLEIRTVNITSAPTQQFWYDVMTAFNIGADSHFVPMLFIGTDVLVGDKIISDTLPGLIDTYLAAGGTTYPLPDKLTDALAPVLPTPLAPGELLGPPAPIYLAYFYQANCDECTRVEADLASLMAKYPQVQIGRFDIHQDLALYQYLSIKAGVPITEPLTAPSLFVGDKYLLGVQLRALAIETLITPYLESGSPQLWLSDEAKLAADENAVIDRFRSYDLPTILGAGLLGGINPFILTILTFLVCYLVLGKYKGRTLLATGGAFTVGVILAYVFGLRFGLYQYLAALPSLNVVAFGLSAFMALLCLVLAATIILAVLSTRTGKLGESSRKLLAHLRVFSLELFPEKKGSASIVLSGFVLGIVASILGLAFSGQQYLPTIIYMLNIPAWRSQASLALLLYSVMFILPLIGVFLLVYFDTASQQFMDWVHKHPAAVKWGTAILLVLLAAWLGYSILST